MVYIGKIDMVFIKGVKHRVDDVIAYKRRIVYVFTKDNQSAVVTSSP